MIRAFFILCFGLGIALRWKIFGLPIREGDEQVYKALVEYVLAGQTYSMSTHPLVKEGVLSSSIYGAPIFYHPPAGIYFFALFAKVGRIPGLKLAQLACFAIFFWSMVGCVREALPHLRGWRLAFLAPLIAFTPIVAQINLRVWIDNPKTAFFTTFLYLLLLARRLPAAWWPAGIMGVIAVLTKVDTLAAFPFALLMAVYPGFERPALKRAGLLGVAGLLAALAWSLYAGTLFQTPSMPTPESVALNRYSLETTMGISPAEFVVNFFKVITSALPAMLTYMFLRRKPYSLAGEVSLLAILALLLIYWLLCMLGYAKLLRYLCLTAPFGILLVGSALERLDFKRRLAWPFAALLLLGIATEVGQGLNILVNKPRIALIEPVF